jgi:hypothetical protein
MAIEELPTQREAEVFYSEQSEDFSNIPEHFRRFSLTTASALSSLVQSQAARSSARHLCPWAPRLNAEEGSCGPLFARHSADTYPNFSVVDVWDNLDGNSAWHGSPISQIRITNGRLYVPTYDSGIRVYDNWSGQ